MPSCSTKVPPKLRTSSWAVATASFWFEWRFVNRRSFLRRDCTGVKSLALMGADERASTQGRVNLRVCLASIRPSTEPGETCKIGSMLTYGGHIRNSRRLGHGVASL
jgi:hypothetical protein